MERRFSLLDYRMDLDQFEQGWITTARQYWRPVHRKRKSVYKTMVIQLGGEDVWIVGEDEMPESELKRRVKDLMIRNVRPVWGIVTEDERKLLIDLEID